MRKPSVLIAAAYAGMMANPVMKHMRDVASAPVSLPTSRKYDLTAINKAEEKRLRKQARNLKNAANFK